jgi:hypothetical protein
MHSPDPGVALYVFTAHFEQARPFGPVWPGLHVHAETLLFPVPGVLLLAGHVVHVVAAATLAYVPAPQFVQDVVLSDCLYVPTPQLRHAFPFVPA